MLAGESNLPLFFLFSRTLKICVYICTHYTWRHIFWDVNKKGKCVAFGILLLRRDGLSSWFQHTVSALSPTFQAQHLFRSSAAPATLLLRMYPSEQQDAPTTARLWSSRGDSSKASESNLGPARYFQRSAFMCISGPCYCCLVELLSRRNEQVWGAQKQKQDSFGNSNICLFFKDSKSPRVIWGLVCWSESLLQPSPRGSLPFHLVSWSWPWDASPPSACTQAVSFAHGQIVLRKWS